MSSTEPSAPPGWLVVVDKPAQKQLDRLPPRDFDRVDAALRSMAVDPFGGDLERLTKHDRYSFRRRVGDYRILFNVDTAARRVRVGAIDRRTTTTYRKRRRSHAMKSRAATLNVALVDVLLAENLASPTEPVNVAWWKARRDHLAGHRRERAKKQQQRKRP